MSEQKNTNRRDVLGKITKFGTLAGLGLLGACARKPDYALNQPLSPYEPRRGIQVIKYVEESVVVEDYATGNQYLVSFIRPAQRGKAPRLDCVREEKRPGPRSILFPGLMNPLLDSAHKASQSFKLAGCEGYFKVTKPALDAVTGSITRGIAEMNKYELNKYVYGAADENGNVIRAAEDPNRIIVIEPYLVRSSNLLNRLLHRSTTPGTAPKPKGLA